MANYRSKSEIKLSDSELEFTEAYKQCKRREDDIAIVTGCFSVSLDKSHVIQSFRSGLGGVAAVPKIAKELETFLIGKPFDLATLQSALKVLLKEIALGDNVPGGMERYREALALGFLQKFWYTVLKKIDAGAVPKHFDSIIEKLSKVILV